MPRRIVLVRHGPSAVDLHRGWCDRTGVDVKRGVYDAAGIRGDSHPPALTARFAAEASCIVCSDLTRAVQSAERLAAGRGIQVSPLLREVMLPIPDWSITAPSLFWESAVAVAWGIRILRGNDPDPADAERASKAVDWLNGLSQAHPSLVVVTHGVFRRLLSIELRIRGWTEAVRHDGYKPWSAWELTIA